MKTLFLILLISIFCLTSCNRGQTNAGSIAPVLGPSSAGLQTADSIKAVNSGTSSTGTGIPKSADTANTIKAPVFPIDTAKKKIP